MNHPTTHLHATDIAADMGHSVEAIITEPYLSRECAILVMLLISMQYEHKQVDDLLQKHTGFRNSMRLLDIGISLYQTKHEYRALYTTLIERHGPRDNDRGKDSGAHGAKQKGAVASGRDKRVAGAKRKASGFLRPSTTASQLPGRPARHEAAH